jgi:hypothetical protein
MQPEHTSDQPHALAITPEQTLDYASLASLGYKILPVDSLLDGYLIASRMLAAPVATPPLTIFIELAAKDPVFPALSGMILSAALARRMRLRELGPAWMLGLVAPNTSQHGVEGQITGCHHLLSTPFTDESLFLLGNIRSQAVPFVSKASEKSLAVRAIDAFQTTAQRVIDMVEATRFQSYTAEDITLLLHWLTPYPAHSALPQKRSNAAENSAYVERLLCSLGGSYAARELLATIARQWEARYPLHSAILQRFLEGWERREIVQDFVRRKLYEDSRIYHCIHELPYRISDYLHKERAKRQTTLMAEQQAATRNILSQQHWNTKNAAEI